jgi:hypothetical protein
MAVGRRDHRPDGSVRELAFSRQGGPATGATKGNTVIMPDPEAAAAIPEQRMDDGRFPQSGDRDGFQDFFLADPE